MTQLTFDIASINKVDSINPLYEDYGDNVTSFDNEIYSYGNLGGFTPNVTVEYPGDPLFWDTGYGVLNNVLYDAQGSMEIVLSADEGYKVKLEQFDLAGYQKDREVKGLSIDIDGTTVYQEDSFIALGATSPFKTEFDEADFGGTIEGSQITIQFLGSKLIGIDNIVFSQSSL